MILGDAQVESGLRVYAIGDVHGCFDQLIELLERIRADREESPVENCKIIFLGDYVDRGPDNNGVLDYLISLQEGDEDCIFLMGNHDERMVSFIENPAHVWDDMMRWGGAQTIASYGVIPVAGEEYGSISKRFAEAVPTRHLEFLKSLKPSHEVGDYFFCHAGVRPGVSLQNQSALDLMWIRSDFTLHEKPFEKVVIHGHTPQDVPEVRNNRLNIDTRCYDTGVLTAVALEGKSYRFLQTGGF